MRKEAFYVDDMQDTEIHYQDGCTITTYYENGRAVNAFALCPDGSYYTEEFYSDGKVKLFQSHNIDGQIITIHYYSNGRTYTVDRHGQAVYDEE